MHKQFSARAAARQFILTAMLVAGLAPQFADAARLSGNTPPTISGTPATLAVAGTRYAFQPTASDANRDTLKFKIQGRPGWATFNSVTGALTGTPTSANLGTYSNIVISVSDGRRGSSWVSLPAFSVTVEPDPNSRLTDGGGGRGRAGDDRGAVAALHGE